MHILVSASAIILIKAYILHYSYKYVKKLRFSLSLPWVFSLCNTLSLLLSIPPTIHPTPFPIHHFFPLSISSYVWMLTPQSEKQTQFFPQEQVAHVGANHTHTEKHTHTQTCTRTHIQTVLVGSFIWSN